MTIRSFYIKEGELSGMQGESVGSPTLAFVGHIKTIKITFSDLITDELGHVDTQSPIDGAETYIEFYNGQKFYMDTLTSVAPTYNSFWLSPTDELNISFADASSYIQFSSSTSPMHLVKFSDSQVTVGVEEFSNGAGEYEHTRPISFFNQTLSLSSSLVSRVNPYSSATFYYPQSIIDSLNSGTIAGGSQSLVDSILLNPIEYIKITFDEFDPKFTFYSNPVYFNSSESYIHRINTGENHTLNELWVSNSSNPSYKPFLLSDGRLVLNPINPIQFDAANSDWSTELYFSQNSVNPNDVRLGFTLDSWTNYIDVDAPKEMVDGNWYVLAQTTPTVYNPPVVTSTYYVPQNVLDAINAVNPQIKSVKVTFTDIGFNSIDASQSYIETLDSQKYYLNSVFNNGVIIGPDGSNLEIAILPNTEFWLENYNGSYNGIGFSSTSNIYVQIDDLNLMFEAPFASNLISLSSTPVVWSGGGGGGPSTPGLVSHDGKVVGTVADNPTQVEVLFNGQPLPEGSVVRFGSQKFLKVSGGSMEFLAIEVTPKPEWGWDPSADADWAVLQGF